MQASVKRQRPTGVTILAILYILGGIFFTVVGTAVVLVVDELGAIIPTLGSVAPLVLRAAASILFIVAAIEFVIGAALLSGKSWGRKIVIILAIINLILEVTTIVVAGNFFGVVGMIIDGIVLFYMWRPHVREYFEGPHTFGSNTEQADKRHQTYSEQYKAEDSEQTSTSAIIDVCPACGTPIASKANFCYKCGSKIKRCLKCTSVNSNESLSCSKCGQSFTS